MLHFCIGPGVLSKFRLSFTLIVTSKVYILAITCYHVLYSNSIPILWATWTCSNVTECMAYIGLSSSAA